MQQDNILKLWRKADKDDTGKIIWHPLAYHMLDVAAVADVWFTRQTMLTLKLLYPQYHKELQAGSSLTCTTCRKETRHSEMTHRKDLINQVLTMSHLTQLVQDQSMKKETFRG